MTITDQTTDSPDVDDFLTGGGGKSASFKEVGDKVTGIITAKRMMQQTEYGTGTPKTWDDGKPMMQAAITLQTDERDPAIDDDDGLRNVYLKGSLKNEKSSAGAVAKALKAAGASKLEIGGQLAMQYTGVGVATRGNPPKEYVAAYKPPTPNPNATSAEDLFDS